uniref:Ig-like domain-containing protein n=1 Tax=Denticeps clupeoides TaxID=299321 RepID=A0AAY4E528_9TELE
MSCKLSSDSTQGVWSKDGEQVQNAVFICSCHFPSNRPKSDVPELDPDELHRFSKPVIVKAGQNASFKMTFAPQDSLEIRWFKDGVGLQEGGGVKIQKEPSHSRLLMKECLRSDSGEIKILLKNPFGSVEAIPPSILVPLKVHTPPKGYQCYMTCAIRGCPAPHVSWYLDGICISGDKHYYITNAHGVCSMYILRVSTSDSGEYKVVAVNSHGKAECSTKLRVKGMDSQSINQSILFMQRF